MILKIKKDRTYRYVDKVHSIHVTPASRSFHIIYTDNEVLQQFTDAEEVCILTETGEEFERYALPRE